MKARFLILLSILLLCSFLPVWGDSSTVRGSYTQYPESACKITRPPFGYRPFYISHYGRHGSRYLLNENEFAAVELLSQHAEDLTAEGGALLEDLKAIKLAHEGMLGILSDKGSRQQYGIGNRLAKCMRRLFRKKNREIRCSSTPMPRCIQSMSNFVLGLRDGGAKGQIEMKTGYKYFEILSSRVDDSQWRAVARALRDSIIAADVFPAVGKLFFVEGRCPEKNELAQICSSLYAMGAAAPGLDEALPDIFGKHLDESIAIAFNKAESYYDYCLFCESAEKGNLRIEKTAKPLLRDILAKAEDAVSTGKIAADLRFGHDSGLLPLLKLTGIGCFSENLHPAEAYTAGWRSADMVPMASNLQIRFFRNRRGSILVQFLLNEKETDLPVLKARKGCFYDWNEVAEYFRSRTSINSSL